MHHALTRVARLVGIASALAVCAGLLPHAIAPAHAAGRGGEEARDGQAAIPPFQMVVARLDTIDVSASASFANAVRYYEEGRRSVGLGVLVSAGSVALGLERLGAGAGDYHLAVDALIGRAFIMFGDEATARPWLESALAEGEGLTRSDAELSGILRDLAWLASRRGDTEIAEVYRRRANVCPLKCGADIIWRVSLDAGTFREAANEALGKDKAAEDIWAAMLADGDAFIRRTVVPGSRLLAELLRYESTISPAADRPARMAEAIALFRANGVPEEDLWSDRVELISFLGRAGETEAAVAAAGELIAELVERPAGDPFDGRARRAAADAADRRFQALKAAAPDRAALAFRQAVDLAIRALLGPNVSARDLRITDLVAAGVDAGFDADARRLARLLLAFEPGSDDLPGHLLTLAERAGDAAEAGRLRPLISPTADDARTRALSRYGDDGAELAATYPDVVPTFESTEEDYADGGGYSDLRLAAGIGAATVGLGDAGTGDDRIAADVVLARFFMVRGGLDEARRLLLGALDRIAASGRGDAFAASVLRDLARLARRAGDEVGAAAYEGRAAACRLPCADDLMANFAGDVAVAVRAAGSFSDRVKAAESEAAAADAVAATDTVFAAFPDLALAVFQINASSFASTRPWEAIDFYQRILDLGQASGADIYGARLSLATLLLQVNEFDRLVAFIDSFRGDAVGADFPIEFARLRARGLWHAGAPAARAAYADIVAATTPGNGRADVLKDLIDGRYADLVEAYADIMLVDDAGREEPLVAKAWLAAVDGRFDDAANLLAGIRAPRLVTALQRAHYLQTAGRAGEAAALRASLDIEAWATAPRDFSLDPPAVREIIDLRDYGAYEGAAEGARRMAREYDFTGADRLRLDYRDAQILWQIAYSLARGGEAQQAFSLMKTAAETAARISFETAGGANGGSLQLLRRDRYNYLLFVDIAWAWTTGVPPQSMTMSSRY